MGVTEIRLLTMGMPNSFSISAPVETSLSAVPVILSYIFRLHTSVLLSIQSSRLMPSVIVRTSRFSFSIIAFVSITSLKFIIPIPLAVSRTSLRYPCFFLWQAQRRTSDSVHHIKNILALRLDNHSDFPAELFQLPADRSEFLRGLRRVHNHHHVEISGYDRLRDVQNINAVLREIGTHFRDDSNPVFADHRYNCSVHISSHSAA